MISAPIAPMAPAWLTVAIPMMIEPSTMKIRASGGTNARQTLRTNRASEFSFERHRRSRFRSNERQNQDIGHIQADEYQPGVSGLRETYLLHWSKSRLYSEGIENCPVACLNSVCLIVVAWSVGAGQLVGKDDQDN